MPAEHTRVDLYRSGNATSARLDHVRSTDLYHFDRHGVTWVRAGTGGVSTFEAPRPRRRRWWRLAAGYMYAGRLIVRNDGGDHWLWEPRIDMPLSDFEVLLSQASQAFR